MGAVLAMAKGTVSVEPAGGAEKATTAKLEASEPRAHGKAGSRYEGCCKARPAMMSLCQDTAASEQGGRDSQDMG